MPGCMQMSWKYLGAFHKNETQGNEALGKETERGFFKDAGRGGANSSHVRAF